MTISLPREKNDDHLLPTMEKVGFIQRGQQVFGVRDKILTNAAPMWVYPS